MAAIESLVYMTECFDVMENVPSLAVRILKTGSASQRTLAWKLCQHLLMNIHECIEDIDQMPPMLNKMRVDFVEAGLLQDILITLGKADEDRAPAAASLRYLLSNYYDDTTNDDFAMSLSDHHFELVKSIIMQVAGMHTQACDHWSNATLLILACRTSPRLASALLRSDALYQFTNDISKLTDATMGESWFSHRLLYFEGYRTIFSGLAAFYFPEVLVALWHRCTTPSNLYNIADFVLEFADVDTDVRTKLSLVRANAIVIIVHICFNNCFNGAIGLLSRAWRAICNLASIPEARDALRETSAEIVLRHFARFPSHAKASRAALDSLRIRGIAAS